MKLATYLDGHENTALRALQEHHTIASRITIGAEHQDDWREALCDRLGIEEVALPTKGDEPVPVTLSTDELWDMVDDMSDQPFIEPYLDDLRYMCCEDPCGMGIVYVMGNRA